MDCAFERIATVYGWDDVAKLNWLKLRLTGRAQKIGFSTGILLCHHHAEKTLYLADLENCSARGTGERQITVETNVCVFGKHITHSRVY